MDVPDTRFVRVETRVAEVEGDVGMTFLADTDLPTVDNHGVLAQIQATDPARAALIQQRLADLVAQTDRVFAWLEASPDNTTLFVEDPISALRKALPALPPGFFESWAG